MRRSRTIEHYKEVKAWEREQVDTQFLSAAPTLGMRQKLRDFDRLGTGETLPLPSHEILRYSLEIAHRLDRAPVGQFVTNHMLRLVRLKPDQPSASVAIGGTLKDSCAKAEPNFMDALRHVNALYAGKKSHIHDRASVYTDDSGEPLLFRKARDESTALLLRPAKSKDSKLVMPAGTMVAVEKVTGAESHAELIGSHSPSKTGKGGVYVYSMTDNTVVSPLRLSPWAYDNPLDRALFAVDPQLKHPTHRQSRESLVTGAELGDFQEAVQQIIRLCS